MAANILDGDLKKGLLAALIFPIFILIGIAALRSKQK
jgi:hypothetical protein